VSVSGISISGADAGNYTLQNATASTTADITTRLLTVSATGVNRAYDGTDSASVTLSDNRVPGDTLTLTYSYAYFNNKNVGNGKTVTVEGISVTGADADNYTFNTTTVTTASITTMALTVSATGVNKVYDATVTAKVNLSSNKVSGDVITLSCTGASFNDKNIGTNKAVNVTGISIGGADAGNYALQNTTTSTTANITAKALTVIGLTANSKAYNGTTEAILSGTASLQTAAAPGTGTTSDGRPYTGDAVSLTGTPSGTFSDPLVGSNKNVTVSGLSLTGAQAGNYSLTPLVLKASITSGGAANKRLIP
jgi:hypothetical protein